MIHYKRGLLRIAEVWFDEEPPVRNVDIVRFFQRTQPLPGSLPRPYHTIVIDLNEAADVLFAKMNKGARYEIRRAKEKDFLVYKSWRPVPGKVLDDFRNAFDQFATSKGITRNHNRLLNLNSIRGLQVSSVSSQEGEILTWHVYAHFVHRVRLLHSASSQHPQDDNARKALYGRANRFHHWQDLLTFQADAVHTYDFGGWYAGNADPHLLGINKFKEEFGGTVICNYNFEIGVTVFGRIVLAAYRRFSK